MSLPTSDAAFELIGACVHSLRFAFGGPVNYPDAEARFTEQNPPSALFHRVQVASPPPGREGAPWYTGLSLDNKPFQPTGWSERFTEVQYEDGIPSLDVPDPDTIVLNEWITVPRMPEPVAFPGEDRGRYLLSIRYWPGNDGKVRYYGTFRLPWTRPPESDWIAVSFDAFWPPERDSADLIIPLGECDAECPR